MISALLPARLTCFLGTFLALATALLAQTTTTGVTEIPNASQPRLALGAGGRVWLVYGRPSATPSPETHDSAVQAEPMAHGHSAARAPRAGEVWVASSDDGGSSFGTPRRVITLPSLSLGNRRGPRLAVHGDRITITVIANELLALTSFDKGQTWSEPVTVNDVPDSAREGLQDLAAGPDGELFATWLDLRNGAMELWGAASTDGGQTWTPDEQIYRSPGKSICECCHPNALYDGDGNLAVMWRNSVNGSRDMWLTTRPKGAIRFTAARKLGEGTWKLDACPMDGGKLIAFGHGEFGAVWQRAGEVFLIHGEGAESSLGQGKQPVALQHKDGLVVIWQQDNGLVMRSGDAAGGPLMIAEDARFPALVSLPDDLSTVVAFESGPKGATSVNVRRL